LFMHFWNIQFVHLSILYTVYFSYHVVESYTFVCNYCNIINVNFFIVFCGMLYNCNCTIESARRWITIIIFNNIFYSMKINFFYELTCYYGYRLIWCSCRNICLTFRFYCIRSSDDDFSAVFPSPQNLRFRISSGLAHQFSRSTFRNHHISGCFFVHDVRRYNYFQKSTLRTHSEN